MYHELSPGETRVQLSRFVVELQLFEISSGSTIIHFDMMLRVTLVWYFRAIPHGQECNFLGLLAHRFFLGGYVAYR